MVLGQFFGMILIGFFGATVFLAKSALKKPYTEYRGNVLLGILCISSAVWSLGFGIVFIQQDVDIAYYGRCLGMIGVFGMLISAQLIINELATAIPASIKKYCEFYSFLGIPIYFLTVKRDVTEFTYAAAGMTYTFKSGMENNIYTAYSLVFGINTIITIALMHRTASTVREKTAAKKMLSAIIIIFIGMFLDTVFPLVGLKAIPGSSLTQFFGTIVVFYAIVDYNKTRLTSLNMSSYVYSFMSEPVLIFSNDEILMLMNEAAAVMFPQYAECLKEGKTHLTDIFYLESSFARNIDSSITRQCSTVNGSIPVEISAGRIRDGFQDPLGFIVAVKDMTQITAMIDSLNDAREKAEEASVAKSAFLANMSHEIRTPLNAIMGFSDLLLKGGLSEEEAEYAHDINSSSQNLLAIINDILDISKIESGRMELVGSDYRLSDVLKDACLITGNLADAKGLEFISSIDDNIPDELYGDPVRVRGVLVNVLNNAVKYTPAGNVKFTAALENIDVKDALLRFEISDSGIGIKEEDIPKLFDSFSQVDKKVNRGIEGTGLGLAIVKGYVNLMNGNIEVKSEYGSGSTFIIRIHQRVTGTETVGQARGNVNKKKSGQNENRILFTGVRVLSVDDSRVNLKLVERSLAKYGMEITSAPSGEEAIEKCRNNTYDVILMDQMMPVMDGIEAMKEIRKLSKYYAAGGDCIIIALTANAVTGVKEELMKEGFDDYLSKPMNFKEIERMFAEYADRGRLHIK